MQIAKSTLREATRRLRRVPRGHTTIPALSCIRITRNAEGIRFSASNLSQFLTVLIPEPPAPGELSRKIRLLRIAREACDILVPSSTLHRCAEAADKGTDLTLTPDAERGGAQITYTQGGVLASVPAQGPSVEEFPADPSLLEAGTIFSQKDPVPFDRVLEAIERAGHCVSTDQTRYVLNGVLWSATGEVVATDGRRLHLEEGLPPAEKSAIIPTEALAFLEPGMSAYWVRKKSKDAVREHLSFQAKLPGLIVRLTTELIEGNYPNFRQVVPEPAPLSLRFDNTTVAKALRGLAASNNTTDAVNLLFDQQRSCVIFRMKIPEVGESSFTVPALFKGRSLKPTPKGKPDTACSAAYLIDAFRHHDTIHYLDPMSPLLFTGIKPNHSYILMPMRLCDEVPSPAVEKNLEPATK